MKKPLFSVFFLLFAVFLLPFVFWALSVLWKSHKRLVDKSVQSAFRQLHKILHRDLEAMVMVQKAQDAIKEEGV